MADQVNLIGGLPPGASQTPSSATVPQRSTPAPAPVPPSKGTGEAGPVRAGSEEDPKPTAERVKQAAQKVAAFVNATPSDVKFMVDDSTGQYYFKIVDAVTHKVIRQVPSEEVLAMAQRLQQISDGKSVTGLLVDAKG